MSAVPIAQAPWPSHALYPPSTISNGSDQCRKAAVAATLDRTRRWALHPVHAFFLAAAVPLFLGALLSDIGYAASYQVQWTNFASWLIAGGLVFSGVALVLALVGLARGGHRTGRGISYCVIVLATWVLGFINALVHAMDAWASMPGGLVLSAIVTALAVLATWIGFSAYHAGEAP